MIHRRPIDYALSIVAHWRCQFESRKSPRSGSLTRVPRTSDDRWNLREFFRCRIGAKRETLRSNGKLYIKLRIIAANEKKKGQKDKYTQMEKLYFDVIFFIFQ